MLYGGIEAGGTKMVCAVSDEKGNLCDRIQLPTKQPQETVPQILAYFRQYPLAALGIGCFGPLDLNPASDTYGYITTTPKQGWANYDIAGVFRRECQIPVALDTDVNGAVLGEVTWGAAKGCDCAIYITVGTGVGIGVYVNGGLLHGLVHPEAGHILLSKHPSDSFEGVCPYHPNCMEGLASGPAIKRRWGKPAEELTDCGKVWELEAYYIAQALADYILAYSPQKIILWGGVMHQQKLFAMVRRQTAELLNGYISHAAIDRDMDNYIVAPGLSDNSGILGAIRLGMLATN